MTRILGAAMLALMFASPALGQGGALLDEDIAAVKQSIESLSADANVRLDDLAARVTALESQQPPPEPGPALTQLSPTPDGRFLVDATGQPFFWFGDTVWPLTWRPSRADITMYLDDRQARGFNVIQFMAIPAFAGWNDPNVDGDRPFISGDITRPNEPYWQFTDWVVTEITARGMRAAMVPMWESHIRSEKFKSWNADDYGRFIGQRYGKRANVIILNGGDLAVHKPNREDWRPVVRAFAAGVEQSAPGALIGYHPGGNSGSWFWIGKDSWLDFHMAQSGHCPPQAYGLARLGYERDWSANSANVNPPKPVIDGEPVYEHIPLCFIGPDRATALDIRRSAYHSVFAGGIGWTYGNNNSRQFRSRAEGWKQTADWQDALSAPAIGHLLILKNLIESFDMRSRVPDQSLIVTTSFGKRRIVGTRGNGYALVYTPGDAFTVRMGKIGGLSVRAAWLNPRTGARQAIGTLNNSGTAMFTPPSALDWVLILESA